jgi:phosphoribosylformylglycinamidine synthase
MARFAVFVEVSLRHGIADPQGSTIERALPALGFDGIEDVHQGKAFRFTMEALDEAAARGRVEELCKRFLANPVIEDAAISVRPA